MDPEDRETGGDVTDGMAGARHGSAAAGVVEPGPGGRPLSVGLTMLAVVVAVVSMTTGGAMAVSGLFGYAFGPWRSPEALSPGLIGAAMLGVVPALFTLGRARAWEEARTLVLPVVVVLVGTFAVSLLNGGDLHVARGGSVVLVLFSIGWVGVLGVLALCAVVTLALQYVRPAGPPGARVAPLPGWTKPFLAVLGAGWLGAGAGLLGMPGFWGQFVPWSTSRADAQGLGVWALAMGIGVLGSLAEDDLARSRPALLAVPGVAAVAAVVLAANASAVDWASGGAFSLVSLLAGLMSTGLIGRWLLARQETSKSAAPEAGSGSGSGPAAPGSESGSGSGPVAPGAGSGSRPL
ncbi:hypothetical protein ABT160_22865 [Streptomyces sp. NPDC001941]|uniref:hypothetical protein n=1 Tax=Streptomyces sp. NPDC001941 TaxID=3154659 RepID=UPI00331DE1E6